MDLTLVMNNFRYAMRVADNECMQLKIIKNPDRKSGGMLNVREYTRFYVIPKVENTVKNTNSS